MNWPQPCGAPVASGTIRMRPEDFFVDEVLGFDPVGSGEHLLVRIEKIGANTAWVASGLAKFCRVASRDVSYAGRKDRHAVTRQWFSVWLPGRSDPLWSNCEIEGVRILESVRHNRKLRRGALAANNFTIVVRELRGAGADLQARLAHAAATGVPNFFGPQRFGRGGSNLTLARRWFAGETRLKANKRSMALSAARAEIFNAVLARRISDGSWIRPACGDALNLDRRGGFFVCAQPDEDIVRRINAGELHVTGPLWGDGDTIVGHGVAALENEVALQYPDLAAGLVAARLDHERRPLRVMPASLSWQLDSDVLTLRFALPKGSFATSVLSDLLAVSDSAVAVSRQ
ncbi:MAG: tRNA pseudouridine(13) synthase TruD [Gammaproteobacteria bacterium]|nr:tRNA pseudouridine(13) synthase TruD [Gammaproteobacteria bacterium]